MPRMPPPTHASLAMHAPLPHSSPTMHALPTMHAPCPCHARPLPCTPPIMHIPHHHARPLWTEFLTHASESITFPQTSFAVGKEGPGQRQCLIMDMAVVLGVCCTGVNQCGPLYAQMRTLTWTLGIVSP